LAIGLTSIHDIISHPEKAKMETQVRTPQAVFMQPQRLVVPLFQRPYVWNEENHWEPLCKDMARMTAATCKRPGLQRGLGRVAPSPFFGETCRVPPVKDK
jgi:hypothetical protein